MGTIYISTILFLTLQLVQCQQVRDGKRFRVDLRGENPSEDIRAINAEGEKRERRADVNETCSLNVWQHSISYFESRLKKADPYFMHFRIKMVNDSGEMDISSTSGVFKPGKWVWTFKTTWGLYPYLFWNIDFGLLSFGLLEAQTLKTEPYVQMNATGNCSHLKYGTQITTIAIAQQLTVMTSNLKSGNRPNPKYEESYFCFLAEAYGANMTPEYIPALYLLYPINYINYNCCKTFLNYSLNSYSFECLENQMLKWKQCTLGPYILGIIMFFYCPILFFNVADWLSIDEEIICEEYKQLKDISEIIKPNENQAQTKLSSQHANDADWVYLDGTSPRTFSDVASEIWCSINRKYPRMWSRVRRFFCLLMIPFGIYVQLYMYSSFEDLNDLLDHGTPLGFLSLLTKDTKNRKRGFVPALGGADGMFLIYYVIGLVLVVLPNSMKQLVEYGLPRSSLQSSWFNTPLRLNLNEIQALSKKTHKLGPGYRNATDLCVSSIYMLFSKAYWKMVFTVQFKRIQSIGFSCKSLILKILLFPLYIVFCVAEICLCILVYGIPLCSLISITVRGTMRYITSVRRGDAHKRSEVRFWFTSPVSLFVLGYILLLLVLAFSYSVGLIFLESFDFLSQLIVFCFIAVIVFPSVSFGYLFFFVVLLYYIVRLIHDFGNKYLDLLSEAVEISKGLEEHLNNVTTYDGHLIISNVKIHSIKSIRVNNKAIPVPNNILLSSAEDKDLLSPRLRMKDNVYCIPRPLFDFIVERHCPVHQEIMRVLFQIALIVFLIVTTMSIIVSFASTPTSEISEVMHVIFIVTVGALPRVVEVVMSNSTETIKSEIKRRNIEETIVEFWRMQELEARDYEIV